jgi:hypothetical protein
MRPQDPRDLPRGAGHLQRHPVARAQARREQLQRLGCRSDPPRGSHLPGLPDSDLTEIAVHIQPDRSTNRTHFVRLEFVEHVANPRANDNDRYVLEAPPGQVAGAATEKARARSPSSKTACPPAFSLKAPIPVRPTLRSGPDSSPQCRSFMPRDEGSPVWLAVMLPQSRGRSRPPATGPNPWIGRKSVVDCTARRAPAWQGGSRRRTTAARDALSRPSSGRVCLPWGDGPGRGGGPGTRRWRRGRFDHRRNGGRRHEIFSEDRNVW